MLNRLRFQELERAIFKVRVPGCYNGVQYKKGEPFLVIDDANMSNFSINQRTLTSTGRSTEANTSTIESVTFELTNGQVMLGVFGDIFGKGNREAISSFTRSGTEVLNGTNILMLPSVPAGNLVLYFTDDYGKLVKIAGDQYSVEADEVTFVNDINKTITYSYDEEFTSKMSTSIGQLGQELILSLEMQCTAMDIITEEKFGVLLKFPKVVVGADLMIGFNDSSATSGSILYVMALPEELQGVVNKSIFTIDVM